MGNLQIELKRHKLQQQFLEQVELGNHSQDGNVTEPTLKDVQTIKGRPDINSPENKSNTKAKLGLTKPQYNSFGAVSEADDENATRLMGDKTQDTHLDLKDTEHQELKVGVKSNGQKYSVRTNRKRFFYPNEWNNFLDCLASPKQKLSFDILINTGCRYNEGFNIRKRDIDFERGTLTLKVTKIKAKKGQKFPEPRTFRLSTQFLERLKKYSKNLNDGDKIGMLSAPALNIAMKKALIKAGIEDFYMFSLHNVRKTHGNWLNAHEVTIVNICKRLGHDYNTFLGSYASADIFQDKDREGIKEILGDLIK